MSNINYSGRVIHGAYYPHIDGIRALAVLPVVLFHVLARLCPGGFAGVDVFFVISGYLIVGGILRDLEEGRFTIRNFYHRRIRRIMPAYFALIAGVFVTGCAVYYSLPLIHLGDASVMGTVFSANLYFWKLGADYWAPDVHTNPLLHLWSLSVEEQFYLCIPLLCALVWQFRRHWVAPALATLAVLSFAGAVYAVATDNQGSAFYLLHFRAWELLAGALLAMLPAVRIENQAPTDGCTPAIPSRKDAPRKPRNRRKLIASFRGCLVFRHFRWRFALLATAGLLMVLIPYAVLSSKTPFPGAAALSSVVGTALLIRYGQSGWINSLLSWQPFVATGKISYSLYLWHWPVVVFWRYVVYDQLYLYDYIGMFMLALLLSYLSWRFVELPVRASSAWTMRRTFACAAAGIVSLVSIGTLCVFQKGWPTILHRQANRLTNERPRFVESLIRNKIRQVKIALGCNLPYDHFVPFSLGGGGDFPLGAPGQPLEVFLVGDSHAGALQYGLDIVLREQNRGGYVVSRGAEQMFDIHNAQSGYFLDRLSTQPDASKVILAELWRNYSKPSMFVRLEEFAARVKSMGKTLFIVVDVPHYKKAPSDTAARMRIIPPRKGHLELDGLWQSEAEYNRMQADINRNLAEVCNRAGAILVPLNLALKQGDRYIAFAEEKGKTIPLYSDSHHVSPAGSLRVARFLMLYLFPETATVSAERDARDARQ